MTSDLVAAALAWTLLAWLEARAGAIGAWLMPLRFEAVTVERLGRAALLGILMALVQRSLLASGSGPYRPIAASVLPVAILLHAAYWYSGATPEGVSANGYYVYTGAVSVVLQGVVACATAALTLSGAWIVDVLSRNAGSVAAK